VAHARAVFSGAADIGAVAEDLVARDGDVVDGRLPREKNHRRAHGRRRESRRHRRRLRVGRDGCGRGKTQRDEPGEGDPGPGEIDGHFNWEACPFNSSSAAYSVTSGTLHNTNYTTARSDRSCETCLTDRDGTGLYSLTYETESSPDHRCAARRG